MRMRKLLLIDDDEKLAEPLREYFDRFELSLESETHPLKGIELIRNRRYDLVVLDVMLPEIDGFETCRRIRQFSDIPIVMLTARGEVMDRVVGLELGADDYLPKPFEPRELVARIQNIFRRGKPEESGAVFELGELRVDTARNPCPATARKSRLPPPSTNCSACCCAIRIGCCRATKSCASCAASTPTFTAALSTCWLAACGRNCNVRN